VIVIAVTQLGGGGSEPASAPSTASQPSKAPPLTQAPVTRGGVTVSVLNGTTTPGLAAVVADQLERGGFKRGQVTNAADQQRTATTVQFAPSARRAAQEVAGILKIPRVSALDANTQAIAGPDAQVVVIVGSDRSQQ
jgi:LytR cell envelope-related transcriptional attenuator